MRWKLLTLHDLKDHSQLVWSTILATAGLLVIIFLTINCQIGTFNAIPGLRFVWEIGKGAGPSQPLLGYTTNVKIRMTSSK